MCQVDVHDEDAGAMPVSDFALGSPFHQRILSVTNAERLRMRNKKKSAYAPIIDQYRPLKRVRSDAVSSVLPPGDLLMDGIFEILNSVYRSPQQKIFHLSALAGCLRIIYKKDFEKHKHRVMRKYGFTSRKQQILICAPRRMGKTFSMALLVIAIAIMCSGEEVSIFSPSERQSKLMIEVIAKFIHTLGFGDRILRQNVSQIVVRCNDGGQAKINAFPAVVRTLKGVSGSVLILEEMAQIPQAVLFEVVAPLHQLDPTCMIGISTITDESNFMTAFLTMKDTHGELLFDVTQVFLACGPCRAKGIAAKCKHNSHLLPDWSSMRKRAIINALMSNHQELLEREIGGIASAKNARAFPPAMYEKFLTAERFYVKHDTLYPFIFHSIDPSGAGKGSDFAITTILRTLGMYIIVGLEAFPARRAADIDNLIVTHVQALRKDPRFLHSMSVFIIESNLGLESDHIKHMLGERLENFVVMDERDDNTRVGFNTTNAVKCIMSLLLAIHWSGFWYNAPKYANYINNYG